MSSIEGGASVRLAEDILSEEDEILLPAGARFEWNADSTHQLIDGELIYVDEWEVDEL